MYTCKPLDPDDAVHDTREFFDAHAITSFGF